MASIPCASFLAMNMHKQLHQRTRVRQLSESSTCSEISEDSVILENASTQHDILSRRKSVSDPTIPEISYAQNNLLSRRISVGDPSRPDKQSIFGNISNYGERTWQWIQSGGSSVLGNIIYEQDGPEKSK